MNLGGPGVCRIAQSEMWPRVIGRDIAASADHVLPLSDSVCGEVHGCAHRVTRAPGAADKFQFHPMVVIGIDVSQKHRRCVGLVDDYSDFAVVEEIAKCCSTPRQNLRQPGSFDRSNLCESAIAVVVK